MKVFLSLFLLFVTFGLFGQNLEDFIQDEPITNAKIQKTFRTPRVVNMHSVENPEPGEMILNIGHRFGKLNSGINELFGLDQATMRIGFDYGINSWLGIGIGRSSFQKTYDGYVKIKMFAQERDGFPLTIAGYASVFENTHPDMFPQIRDNFADRLSTSASLMFARKFSERFSLQVSPMWITANYLPEIGQGTDDFSLGAGTRLRLSKMVNMNLEYIAKLIDNNFYNEDLFSLGFDLETGGHVFQLFLSNSQGISDKIFLLHTPQGLKDGAIFFGFNITRVFYFNKK
jgi:hypothetical protein